MLTEERHDYIVLKLGKQHTLTVQELVEELNHSESTIRRDLSQLEEEGKLLRVHGGAKRKMDMLPEESMDKKTVKNGQEKKAIAKRAADLIKDEGIIYLDAGTTTMEMIPFLKGKDVTVVTNGVPHASLLADYHVATILVGGQIKPKTKAVIGSIAQDQLKGYRFSQVFMGMNSIDVEFGCTTPDVEEAVIKKTVINQANEAYVLVDESKFNTVSFAKVCDLDDCTLITTANEKSEHYAQLTRVIKERMK